MRPYPAHRQNPEKTLNQENANNVTRRYYCQNLTGAAAILEGSEAHHLKNVMRAKAGQTVLLFDGQGLECQAEVLRVDRQRAELQILSRDRPDRELPFVLELAVALPKGDRQKWLVEKAVELGATRLTPLRTERSVAQPEGKAIERLRRAVIEASKQCGRCRLMEIAEPRMWSEYAAEPPETQQTLQLTADPAGEPIASAMLAEPWKQIRVAIGPEGGFSEVEASPENWRRVGLGPRILRVETAAIALAAMVAMRPEA